MSRLRANSITLRVSASSLGKPAAFQILFRQTQTPTHTDAKRHYRTQCADELLDGASARLKMSRAIFSTGRQAHSSDPTLTPAPDNGPRGRVRANRRDIRIDLSVEAVRLSFLKVPDRTSFGVRPHSDTTLRNEHLRYATTQRALKDGTRTHSEGPPRASSSGTDPERRNLNATENSLDAWNAPPRLVFRERRENSSHIRATRRHDSVSAMIFD